MLTAASFALFLSTAIAAAPTAEPLLAAPAARPPLRAAALVGTITLDGRLDEAAWSEARPASGFAQIEPHHGNPASRDTEVRVLFDERNLYFGFTCHDPEGAGGVRVPGSQRDWDDDQNDLVGLALDPFGDGRTAQAFQVNPWGAQRDLRVSDGKLEETQWDAAWIARTRVAENGWTAEVAIPWSSLRYPEGSRAWAVNFVRRVRRLEEISGWVPWTRGLTPYRMTFAGALEGLAPPPPVKDLRLQPYVVGSAREASAGNRTSDEQAFELGGELKWLPSASTVVDATVNTDFAQADADRQVVNLSRFSVLFPEKRPFFLENASLFDSGFDAIKPFFSRRIGLDEAGQPIPIDAGLRIVHQDARRSWGGLAVRTAAEGTTPASTFGLARFSQNLGARNRLGALFSGRWDEARGEGEGRSNGVWAVDGLYRPRELFTVQGFVSGSTTSGAGGDGVAGSLWAYSEGPRGYFGWIQQAVSADYEAASGFVVRRDFVRTSPALTLDWRPEWLPKSIRRLRPNGSANLYHSYEDRRFQEGSVRIEPLWVVFQDGSEVWAWWEPNFQRLREPFAPLPGLEVEPGKYDYDRWGIAGATDRSRPFGIEVRHTFGGFYDGQLENTRVTARAVPSPRLAFTLEYERNALSSIGRERGDRTTELWTPELRLALNPRLQWTTFYQRNTAAELESWYSRFSWEIRPLSYLYVVYADLEPTDPGAGFLTRPATTDRQLIVKLTYLWQR